MNNNFLLLDSGNGFKLEQVGEFRLVRPAPNAFWEPSLPLKEWENIHGRYERSSKGGGHWTWFNGGVKDSWNIQWGGFTFLVKPTNFGHLGFFAEQHENWKWLKQIISSSDNIVKSLNLFAYSGASSLAMASAGSDVCHLDAAKGMNDWGKQNLELNPSIPDKIRWITDDVQKFISREIRRESKYNLIVLDPPSFGRGKQGQVWKLEDGIINLLEGCHQIIDNSKPFYLLLSCHTPGFSPIVLERLLKNVFGNSCFLESGEMTIPEQNGRVLPAGVFCRYSSR